MSSVTYLISSVRKLASSYRSRIVAVFYEGNKERASERQKPRGRAVARVIAKKATATTTSS